MTHKFRDVGDEDSSSESVDFNVINSDDDDMESLNEDQDDEDADDNEAEKETIDEDEEEDELLRAIKAEKNKPRDHPPPINSEDFIVDLSFSPAKNLIALANILGDVHLYEYSNDENKLVNTFEHHLKACRDVEFNDDGSLLFTAAKDKSFMASDVETGKLVICKENAHEEPVYCLKCLDNNKLVTGDDNGTVKLWDTRQKDSIFSIKIGEDYVADMVTTDAEKYLACAGGDGVLTSIDLKGRKIYSSSEDYDSDLTCLGLFRSETKLLVGSSKGKLYIFNWKLFGLHTDEYIGNKHSISCMVPVTENIVVTSGEDGVLRAAHMFPQRQLGIVGQHDLPVERLDISHDGQFIASCSHDNQVRFWNISYFETIDSLIDVDKKQNKKRDLNNILPSSNIESASNFFSGLA